MIKKYIMKCSIGVFLIIGSVDIQANNVDSSCSTLCPTCSHNFLKFCRLCKYKDGILKAKCQNPEKPARFMSTSCPVIINKETHPTIDAVNGKLQCESTQQEQSIVEKN